jgi:hypothetical protein
MTKMGAGWFNRWFIINRFYFFLDKLVQYVTVHDTYWAL